MMVVATVLAGPGTKPIHHYPARETFFPDATEKDRSIFRSPSLLHQGRNHN